MSSDITTFQKAMELAEYEYLQSTTEELLEMARNSVRRKWLEKSTGAIEESYSDLTGESI